MGKLHGTLAKAGKVRKQTPKIEKAKRAHKIPKGRAYKRILFNKRFANLVVNTTGIKQKPKSANWHAGRKELIEEEKKKQKLQRDTTKSRAKKQQ